MEEDLRGPREVEGLRLADARRHHYDSSIFIAYKPAALPAGFRLSAVVIQELTAGAVDKSEVQRWQGAMRAHEKEGTLLVPTGED